MTISEKIADLIEFIADAKAELAHPVFSTVVSGTIIQTSDQITAAIAEATRLMDVLVDELHAEYLRRWEE